MSYAKQLRPFKEKVTDERLFQRYDELGYDKVKQKLLKCLDSVVLDNTIRFYIEARILATKNDKFLEHLVMQYTIDYNAKFDSDINLFKKITRKTVRHDSKSQKELNRIRKL